MFFSVVMSIIKINLNLHKGVWGLRNVKLIAQKTKNKEVEFICQGKFDLFFLFLGIIRCRSPPSFGPKSESNGGIRNEKTFKN